MVIVSDENIISARRMYNKRVNFLKKEVSRIANKGMELGYESEEEINQALDAIEDELAGVMDCLEVLNHMP